MPAGGKGAPYRQSFSGSTICLIGCTLCILYCVNDACIGIGGIDGSLNKSILVCAMYDTVLGRQRKKYKDVCQKSGRLQLLSKGFVLCGPFKKALGLMTLPIYSHQETVFRSSKLEFL